MGAVGAGPLAIMMVTLALAGCAAADEPGPTKPAGASTTYVAPAPKPTADDETGSVAGQIIDDEQRPVMAARVTLSERTEIVESDASGNFTFNGVEAGSYTLYAEKLGFVSVGQKVEIRAGEVTTITIILLPQPIPSESQQRSIAVSGYINLGHAWTDYYGGWNLLPACTKCEFYLHFPPTPKDVRFEASWVKPIDVQVLSHEIYYLLRKNWTNGTLTSQEPSSTTVTSGYWGYGAMPRNMEATDHGQATGNLKGVGAMQVRLGGGFSSVAYEQRVDMYWSVSYGAPFETDFSAFKK